MNLPTVSPDYIKALIAANPELAAINQEALAGASTPMPPSIVADKGRFIKKVDGVEETLSFPDTDVYRNAGVVGQPVPQLQCVIMRAKAGKEKAWYATKYTPGQETQSPDCWSDDGVKPDAGSRLKQCESCAACAQNVFGSGTNQDGTPGKGKACADRKVLAVFANSSVFRFAVPPASLGNWDSYVRQLNTHGIPLSAVITVVGFEKGDTSYKLTFEFGGMLAEEQAKALVGKLSAPEVMEIVNPRGAQQALAAPAEQKQVEDKVVDLDAEKAKKAAAEAEKAAKVEAAKAKKEAEKAAKEQAKKEAEAAAAATPPTMDLGLGGLEPAAPAEPAAAAGGVSDDDLIAGLGLD